MSHDCGRGEGGAALGEHAAAAKMRCPMLLVSVAAATAGATAGARPNIVFIQTVRASLTPTLAAR